MLNGGQVPNHIESCEGFSGTCFADVAWMSAPSWRGDCMGHCICNTIAMRRSWCNSCCAGETTMAQVNCFLRQQQTHQYRDTGPNNRVCGGRQGFVRRLKFRMCLVLEVWFRFHMFLVTCARHGQQCVT